MISVLKQGLKQWKLQLVPANFDKFVIQLITLIVENLEKEILEKKINQHGGMLIENDIMHIVNFFQNLTTNPMRKHFMRLIEVACILSLDSLDDIHDYLDNAVNIQLNTQQIKIILSLRVEFSSNRIKLLKI